MIDIISANEEFFSEESYQEYLKKKEQLYNDRLRDDRETIFDALMSPEADFSNTPYGNDIITKIRNYL